MYELPGDNEKCTCQLVEVKRIVVQRGYDLLWEWFGLSRASWITLPRVLAHAMPDEWQRKMAELLEEYDDTFPNQPNLGTRVQITDLNGKLVKTPEWLLHYRHPDHKTIDGLRKL